MKGMIAVSIIILMLVPASALAGTVSVFQSGKPEETAWLRSPTCVEYINLSLPAECLVKSAAMDVSSVLPDANCSDCPQKVQVLLNDSLLWEFNGTDYGALGRQEAFTYGEKAWKANCDPDNASSKNTIRLMKNADIFNATMQLQCKGNGWLIEMLNLTHDASAQWFGRSVSDAGDVNGDGYDDVIVGAPRTMADEGRAYIFYGGPKMDNSPDVVLDGGAQGDFFGFCVAGAGDVNADGYSDVIVGAPYNASLGANTGSAYVFLGGQNMDSTPDLVLSGDAQSEDFGFSVHGAGDLNEDGFDDIIVGQMYSNNQFTHAGQANIYYGGQSMKSTQDVILSGPNSYDYFGTSVSGAGDMNRDGYDDVIVGAYSTDSGLGAAYIYHGGASMDGICDLYLSPPSANFTEFGFSTAGLGDINKDGYDDVIVGASGANDNGDAYIYYGGANMSGSPDVIYGGEGSQDYFGFSVSSTGNIIGDGTNDIIVGAPYHDNNSVHDTGKFYVYSGSAPMNSLSEIPGTFSNENFGLSVSGAGDVDNDGLDEIITGGDQGPGMHGVGYAYIYKMLANGELMNPEISINGETAWNYDGYTNGTFITPNLASVLNNYLKMAPISGVDGYGNAFTDVPVKVGADTTGNITISGVDITYKYKSSISDIRDRLNDYLSAHKSEKDSNGNITIPIKIISKTPGRVKLLNLDIRLDGPPALVQKIPDLQLEEDTAVVDLLDVRSYFKDDFDAQSQLNMSIVSANNQSFVKVGIVNDQYLYVDATVGPGNWTGEASVVVRCADTRNHSRESNEFKIIVYNVNDPPIIVSTPPTNAVAGMEYTYQVVAVDGDNDPITYSLVKSPANMTINSTSGLIKWVPPAGGPCEVIVHVSDRLENSSQRFILMVPYRSPRITNTTVPEAQTGVPYVYDIPAVSDDGRELSFKLLSQIEGMMVDSSSGRLTWTPKDAGDYPVSVNISDSKTSTIYNFTIHAVKGNKVPKFVSEPVRTANVGIPYSYGVKAIDEDNDSLVFSLDKAPAGMTIDASAGKISWTPGAAGNQTVRIKVSDGKGGEAVQEFVIQVLDRVKAQIELNTPSDGQKVKGKVAISGSAIKGTLDIVKVQVRVDSGDWADASGNSTWTYTLDTTKLSNGKHTIQARAYDGTDYSDIVNRTITVDNQKAAGKGFIPGFGAILSFFAIAPAIIQLMRRRRER